MIYFEKIRKKRKEKICNINIFKNKIKKLKVLFFTFSMEVVNLMANFFFKVSTTLPIRPKRNISLLTDLEEFFFNLGWINSVHTKKLKKPYIFGQT